MDIIIPVCNNYFLVDKQIQMWSKIKGDWRLNFCDNTQNGRQLFNFDKYPKEIKDKIRWFTNDSNGIDGERHGGVLDYMISQTTSRIIGIMDSDFLWFDTDILERVEKYFQEGYKCIGTELHYTGFEYVNDLYPERAGWLAPCVFGMFIYKDLCTETFICTKDEGYIDKKETGWRMRQKLINDKIKTVIFKAFQYPGENCGNSWFYKDPYDETVVGVHLLQGSGQNNGQKSVATLNRLYRLYLSNK